MIKILVVDDHPIVQEGLKQILSKMPDIKQIDSASTGAEAIKKAKMEQYEVIVLDISLPDMNGLDVLKVLKNENPDTPILMLSIYPEEVYGIRTLKAGAAGYITKESAPQELVAAIQTVIAHKKYVSPAMGDRLVTELKGLQTLPHERLSDQEYKIFLLIAQGKTLKQIANELFLSVKTVSTYKSHIRKKMNLHSDCEFTYYAIKNGLIK
jgi:DNA-binding NarL/FixJ family response regulator